MILTLALTTLLILCFMALGATAASPSVTPLRDSIGQERQATNHVRQEKCLPELNRMWTLLEIPRSWRPWVLRLERRRHRLALSAGAHRCSGLTWAAYLAIPSWRKSAWQCIHRGEGSWTANTGNGYFGGLQQDLTFQHSYGADAIRRWGLAHRWPWWAQVLVAERAYLSGRGFHPWPNTARVCGLL